MPKTIKLKRGFDIKLEGKAEQNIVIIKPEEVTIKPTDFIGLRYPKMLVNEGDVVQRGTKLCFDKYRPEIYLTSPASGIVSALVRGEKRVLLEIRIAVDGQDAAVDFGAEDPKTLSSDSIKKKLLESGLWAAIRQRPYSIIAQPQVEPKAIFISGFNTAPLGSDQNFVVEGNAEAFQTGINALAKLTPGKVHLSLNAKQTPSEVFLQAENVEKHYFQGPHPAGNIGVQVHHISPINKGEAIWYASPQAVIAVGNLFLKGEYDSQKLVALTGSEVIKPHYIKTITGASILSLVKNNIKEEYPLRYISGNVLSGTKVEKEGFLSFYDEQLTVIPEGNYYEMFGWIKPGINKFSFSKSFLSSWFKPNKVYSLDTNLHGGHRAFVVTGEYEKVIPMDIMPLHLLKAIIVKDIDLMENLGIYEVDEEDFALAEVICPSKSDIQAIIREGLDLMRAEMG